MQHRRWGLGITGVVLVALLSGVLLATTVGWAQSVPDKKIKVQVTINGDDDIKATLGKLLVDEFGKLTDVELVTEKPAWIMEVLGVAPRNEKKEPLIFMTGVLVTQQFSSRYWNGVYGTLTEFVLKRQHDQSDKSAKPFVVDKKKLADLEQAWTNNPSRMTLDAATENMGRKHDYYLKGAHDLRILAQEIVAAFDQGQLALYRKK